MKVYSGIDEAGLGPILGPYCATSISFKSNISLKEEMEIAQKKIFYVDDSKKVYQGKYGLQRLEKNVLAFYSLYTNNIPKNSLEFTPSLNSSWYKEFPVKLPICNNPNEILESRDRIATFFHQKDVKIIDIKRTAISAQSFNQLIDIWDNKSIVCQKILDPLLRNAFIYSGNIVIDKQGGRKFYKEYLDDTLQINVKIKSEEDCCSNYYVDNTQISFSAKADSTYFEVALASMFSKYMREIAMISFNSYWKTKLPNIKETAGYYTDGMRFIKELANNNLIPNNIDSIIRKK
ncbi:MAG: hypothetical protein JXR64_10290 [Spirochaetales bacterium]|nr:hypothetical protein [Spirochaetales bacterium]